MATDSSATASAVPTSDEAVVLSVEKDSQEVKTVQADPTTGQVTETTTKPIEPVPFYKTVKRVRVLHSTSDGLVVYTEISVLCLAKRATIVIQRRHCHAWSQDRRVL